MALAKGSAQAFPVSIDVRNIFESRHNELLADASDLGWAPGFVPSRVDVRWVGNGNLFHLVEFTSDAFVYQQRFGSLRLTVLND